MALDCECGMRTLRPSRRRRHVAAAPIHVVVCTVLDAAVEKQHVVGAVYLPDCHGRNDEAKERETEKGNSLALAHPHFLLTCIQHRR